MKLSTIYDKWVEANEWFMTTQTNPPIVASAGVYTSRTRVSLHATGFELPESILLRDQRIRLLQDRYIDPETWERCYQRFRSQPKGASHTFLFNRQGDRPKAGGCLLSIVLCKAGGAYEAQITSRAIESTMAMLADIAFVRSCLERIDADLGIGLDLQTLRCSWHIGVMHQNRVFVPVFFYDVYGPRPFAKWVHYPEKARNKWERICIEHSQKMINDDGVTGARQLWGRRLRELVYNGQSVDFSKPRARPPVRPGS